MGDVRTAMRMAGYSDNTPIKGVVESLKEEIKSIADTLMSVNTIKGALAIVNVMDDPTRPGAKLKLDAAKEILDRTGLARKDTTNVNVKLDGALILPPKDAPKVIDGNAVRLDEISQESTIEDQNGD